LEDLADATAGGDAGGDGRERRGHERAPDQHREQLPERWDGDGVVVEGLGQFDSEGEAEDGASASIASPSSGTTAARASPTAWHSTTRRRSSGSPS
jgi:hypothetical protein